MSEQTYYADNTQWGNYRFTSLSTIVDEFMAMHRGETWLANTPRYQVLYTARQGIRELSFSTYQEVRIIQLTISGTLRATLPPDYVDYVRMAWKDSDGNLYPLAENKLLDISTVFLQDDSYNILYDESGNVLYATETPDPNVGPADGDTNAYQVCDWAFDANADLSADFANGSYRINSKEGYITFSTDLFTRDLVLEYISDGLYYDTTRGEGEDEIKIHKQLEQALVDFIYYRLVSKKAFVPQNEKQRARKEYYNSKRRANRLSKQGNMEEILQTMKGGTRWIRGIGQTAR